MAIQSHRNFLYIFFERRSTAATFGITQLDFSLFLSSRKLPLKESDSLSQRFNKIAHCSYGSLIKILSGLQYIQYSTVSNVITTVVQRFQRLC